MMKSGSNNLPLFPSDHLFANIPTDEEFEAKASKGTKNFDPTSEIKDYLARVKRQCCVNESGGLVLNECTNKDFRERLLKLSKYFVLWTAVVPKLFYKNELLNTTASSAISEEYFKDVKNLIFRNEKNKSLIEFIKVHHEALSGTTKLLAAIDNKYFVPNTKIDSDTDGTSYENATVNALQSKNTVELLASSNNSAFEMLSAANKASKDIGLDIDMGPINLSGIELNSYSTPTDFCSLPGTKSMIDALDIMNYGSNDCVLNDMSSSELCATSYDNNYYLNQLTLPDVISHPKFSPTLNENISVNKTYNYLNLQDEWGGLLKNKKNRALQ